MRKDITIEKLMLGGEKIVFFVLFLLLSNISKHRKKPVVSGFVGIWNKCVSGNNLFHI